MIGWYVHHHGAGHLHRLLAVHRHLRHPLTGLSSLPAPAGIPWLRLPRDDEASAATDPDAGGTLHWAPRHDGGLLARSAALVDWLTRARPALAVVDVSVEVASLIRLTGVPVAVVAMPGDRTDRAHRHAYDTADLLLAPWPESATPRSWPEDWRRKTLAVGAISRYDGRPVPDRPPPPSGGTGGTVTLLWGSGGPGPDRTQLAAARSATPGWRWRIARGGRSAEEVWELLVGADVVVTHAGQNAVAEVAAARAPAVVVAEERPFGEQVDTVARLREDHLAVTATCWPEPAAWPRLLAEAVRTGGHGWSRWAAGGGAPRAAAALDDLADRFDSQRPSVPGTPA